MDDTNIASVNLVGYLQSSKGIGQVAQGFAAALRNAPVSTSELDLTAYVEASNEKLKGSYQRTDWHPLNLIVVNPPETILIRRAAGSDFLKERYNIGCWWWELNGAPPSAWRRHLSEFDELWAGSNFLRESFETRLGIPVHVVPPVVQVLPVDEADKSAFRGDRDEFLFLFMCDFNSIPERKNPLGVVRAFRSAFAEHEPVRLVMKVSNGPAFPEYYELFRRSADSPNITIIEKPMNRHQVDCLLQSCDAYVSLHRSEGFGLTLAEAMLAGKPVIATGWSGNTDFMTAENSLLVDFDIMELDRDYGPYLRGNKWADPDLEDAAAKMRSVFERAAHLEPMLHAARQTITQDYSVEAVARKLQSHLTRLAPVARAIQRIAGESRTGSDAQTADKQPLVVRKHKLSEGTASPAVSVLLPVFNGEEFLSSAIESVLNQTHEDFELLIADDCSHDRSAEIIGRYAAADSRIIHWRNDRRLGLFPNYNKCLNKATGSFIKPFAQDDLLLPQMLSEGLKVFERHPSVVLFSGDRIFINESNIPHTPDQHELLIERALPAARVLTAEDVLASCLTPLINLIGEPSAVMFPRHAASDGFDQSFHHLGDLEYWFRILQQGNFYKAESPLCQFRLHGNSTTSVNVSSLLFATDTLKLGYKIEPLLSRTGKTLDDFFSVAMDCLAASVARIGEVEIQYGASYLDTRADDVNLLEFHELAYRALKLAARRAELLWSAGISPLDTENGEMVAAYTQDQKDGMRKLMRARRLESEVGSLLRSRSWHVTKPLRDISRALGTANSAVTAEPASSNFKELAYLQQDDYLNYLRKLKYLIKNSRSWALTRPLRAVGLL